MAQPTDMNSATPTPTEAGFRLQMEGLATAIVYVFCFAWVHLGAGTELVTTKVLAVFLVGLIAIPLVAALPLVLIRKLLVDAMDKQPSIAAFLPFARFALYALQGVLVWVVTREAYRLVFGGSSLL